MAPRADVEIELDGVIGFRPPREMKDAAAAGATVAERFECRFKRRLAGSGENAEIRGESLRRGRKRAS